MQRQDGIRHRGKKQQTKTVSFTVGSRPAFFQQSPATHAVYRMDGVIFGLAGDFGGVGMGPDTDGGNSNYAWAGPSVEITQNEASTFHAIAQNVASHMKYDLLTRNCFSPVVTALADLTNRHWDSEAERGDDIHDSLRAMRDVLARQNLGAGQQGVEQDAKKNQ
ncbi:MAG: hypothetical protein AB8G26_00135 [Ilumatobacter sp.]